MPVLNGLLLERNNLSAVLKDEKRLSVLFELFKYQLPLDLYESAIGVLLNVIRATDKNMKMFMG